MGKSKTNNYIAEYISKKFINLSTNEKEHAMSCNVKKRSNRHKCAFKQSKLNRKIARNKKKKQISNLVPNFEALHITESSFFTNTSNASFSKVTASSNISNNTVDLTDTSIEQNNVKHSYPTWFPVPNLRPIIIDGLNIGHT